jgi:amino acid transporter
MKKDIEPQTRPDLRKEISSLGFFSLAFGSMIGVGWVTALGSWLQQAGPLGTMIAFACGGALMLIIGLCYAEVTPMLPVTGGEIAYAYKAYGIPQAFLIGWFLAFGYLSVCAFEAISIGGVLAYMFPALDKWALYRIAGETVYGSHLILAFIFTAIIAFLNYIGVGRATGFQNVLTWGLIAITLIFVVAGLTRGKIDHLAPHFSPGTLGGSLGGLLAVFVTIPFWFVGFDTIPQAAEEAKTTVQPRSLGLYILLAIITATAFYVVVVLSASMTGPWQNIAGADLPTARAFAAAFESSILVNLILIAALIGLLTSWNGFFLAGSRVLFALGRGKIIASAFGKTHPQFGTPAHAILFSGIITFAAACLGRGAMIAFVDVGSFCIVFAFLGVALSLAKLRRNFPDLKRPYRMPGGKILPGLAVLGSFFILGVMLFPGSPAMLVWPLEWLILGVFSLAGVWFWYRAKRHRERISEEQRARLILEDYA